MAFIGIITDPKNETYTRNTLDRDFSSQHENLILIRSQNIQNIKNIRFETILLDSDELINEKDLVKLLEHARNLVINSDIRWNLNKINNSNLQVITFGFNPKATVTISSVTEDNILMCVQRKIQDMSSNIIEPQEIKININKPQNIMANTVIGIQTIRVIYGKIEKN